MEITYDPDKNAINIKQRQLSFESVAEFDFDTALIQVDDRKEYGEIRYVALGLLHGRVHVLVFTLTANSLRVISFRKANKREVKRYEETQ